MGRAEQGKGFRQNGWRRSGHLAGLAAAVFGILAVLAPGVSASSTAPPVPPNEDPFYSYSGSLSGLAPGAVLGERVIQLVLFPDLATPVSAFQLLFRTTSELGKPALGVATVIRPLLGPVLPRVLSWQPFYDSLGPQCDPSYDLRGGVTPTLGSAYFSSCDMEGQAEATGAATFLAQGATVVVTDYEETNQAWAAGPLEGYATLDGIRAAESYLHYSEATTPVAMIGYSGGAIATQWAAELAPAYAPHLDVVAAAAGGVLVDPIHNLHYINGGGTGWSYVIPATMLSIFDRAFGIDVYQYASAYGAELMNEDQDAFINDLAKGNITYQELLQPQYANFTSIPDIVPDLNALIMGSNGTPKASMLLENGEGTTDNGYDGDGIMIASDVEALAHEYCQRGVSVEYLQADGDNHTEASVPFIAVAIPYLSGRLAGLPGLSNCSMIGTGSSLAPLPSS